MTIAVVIPSRLSVNPVTGKPYLHEAVESVCTQDWGGLSLPMQMVIALDPGQTTEPRLHRQAVVVNAPIANQAAAVNTGMNQAVASGAGIIGHLECDDLFCPHHLQASLWTMETFGADFVSSSQELFSDLADAPIGGHGTTKGVFHFPIASSWVMRAEVWKEVGPYSDEFRVHPDNYWLGKLNALKKFRRVHLVENGQPDGHPWLENVRRVSWIVPMPVMFGNGKLSVRRRVQAESVLARASQERSDEEYRRLAQMFGDLSLTW